MTKMIKKLNKGSFKHNEEEPVPLIRHLMSKLVRNETLEGREYLVCPTVLICEGVHNNVLYTKDDIAKFPESWNGRPVVLWHPENNGKPISAASPTVLKASTLGMLYNTKFKEGLTGGAGLVSEVWLDVKKTEKLAPKVLTMLENNEGIEVSTGLFTDDEEPKLNEANDWNGESYTCIARNYRPDHLALLPGGKGACSWDDGAGMPRLNKQEEETCHFHINDKSLFQQADDIRQQVQAQVFPSQEPGSINSGYISDIYDDYAIFRKDGKMFRVEYEIDSDGDVIVDPDSQIEVECETVYVPKTNEPMDDESDYTDQTDSNDDEEDEEDPKVNGGSGSGNFGHAGREGERGGSSGGGGGTAKSSPMSKEALYTKIDNVGYAIQDAYDIPDAGNSRHMAVYEKLRADAGKMQIAAKDHPELQKRADRLVKQADKLMAAAKSGKFDSTEQIKAGGGTKQADLEKVQKAVEGHFSDAAKGGRLENGHLVMPAVPKDKGPFSPRAEREQFALATDPLRDKAMFGDVVTWMNKGEVRVGIIKAPGKDKSTFKVETNGGTFEVAKSEMRMPKGGKKMKEFNKARTNAELPSLGAVKALLPKGATLVRFGTTSVVYVASDGVKQSMRIGLDDKGKLVSK